MEQAAAATLVTVPGKTWTHLSRISRGRLVAASQSRLPLSCPQGPTTHSMNTGEIKSKVDRIWDTLWSGGISNPLTIIE